MVCLMTLWAQESPGAQTAGGRETEDTAQLPGGGERLSKCAPGATPE